MTRLTHDITDGAIFLYPSVEAAMCRARWGGSGFIVGVPSETDPEQVHLFAVTNHHVSLGAPVIRVTKADGTVEILPGTSEDWIEQPHGDDVAVRPLGLFPASLEEMRRIGIPRIGYHYFDWSLLIALEDFAYDIGPSLGEDCLIVGRYVNHNGEQFDRPAVRFGNLSMYPEAVWQNERARNQESFLVDMRSASGFSGSVVIVYFAEPGTISLFSSGGPKMPWRSILSKYWILGVDWGHLPAWYDEKGEDNKSAARVKIESSMAAVVPAWKLKQILQDVDDVKDLRQLVDSELAQAAASQPPQTTPGLNRYKAIRRALIEVRKDAQQGQQTAD